MNILLINHYAGSPRHGMEFRPYYLSREWVRMGHLVTVVAATFSHLRSTPPISEGVVTVQDIEGIQYVWLATPAYEGNGLGRVRNMIAFLWGLRRAEGMLATIASPQAVIASSTYPLDIYPAARIAKRCHARLVFEVHDLWPLSPIELGGMSRWHPFIVMMQMAEDFAYRKSDRVVSILPAALPHMRGRGLAPERFVHIPNGVDLGEWERREDLPEEHVARLRELRVAGRVTVCYAGAHGTANALESVVDAAGMLRDTPVTFVFVGSGPEKEGLRRRAESKGIDNVVFFPPVPKRAVPALLEAMDVLFISLRRQPLFRFGISPNKLMDYMMAGRPIICAIEAGNDPVGESGSGVTIAAESPSATASAVRQMLGMSAAERTAMGTRGPAYVRAHHDYRVLARQFVAAME